jgi:hypothetical protein
MRMLIEDGLVIRVNGPKYTGHVGPVTNPVK